MKRVAIAGSTGSIGTQTLEVIAESKSQGDEIYELVALSVNSSVEAVIAQAQNFKPKLVVVANESARKIVAKELAITDPKIEVAADDIDRPEWMGSVDFSGLKLKLIGSLVAISVIELLKDFMNAANGVNETEVKWRIAIHLTFVVSGLAFAIMDWVADLNKKPKGK